MCAVGGLGNQDVMIRRDNKGIPNGQFIPFEVGGEDGFEQELGMNKRGHYIVGKKKRWKKDLRVVKDRRISKEEKGQKRQSCEADNFMFSETLI